MTKKKPGTALVERRHKATPLRWAFRLVGYGEEPPDQLLANPHNWRLHTTAQQDALRGALDELGWLEPVLVNRVTGHLVNGHLRVALAISEGQASVPVAYCELTPEEEHKALLTLDPISRMAGGDPQLLDDLLRQVTTAQPALQSLFTDLQQLHPLAASTERAPLFPEAEPTQYAVTLTFTDRAKYEEAVDQLSRGTIQPRGAQCAIPGSVFFDG